MIGRNPVRRLRAVREAGYTLRTFHGGVDLRNADGWSSDRIATPVHTVRHGGGPAPDGDANSVDD
jgi:hypothetical protein